MVPAALAGVGYGDRARSGGGDAASSEVRPATRARPVFGREPGRRERDDKKLTLTVKYPAGATLKLDGGTVEGNPFTRTLSRDGSMHSFEVTQPGFEPEKRTE